MANLRCKTRGNSSPQGKPRVYFCCHSNDFNEYFESVSDEILTKQNCAIWYVDESAVRDEDFFADLKQMQLFVMPVTTNLLCTENEALDTEFKFAIENHIPVLPLMQESGLEELFNKKCGDLQFLDKNNADVTTISYDEKLKKYLESVLIGDELAEKIRAAFDAYVFLSYRKKDRKYAQELMRLIHKNEFCRDIAIWYDEFLTPGENFNDSIKEALQKSGLFVLTVTPNLVNEPNYIMTTEYPMAKQEGKPILPAELVPTDREQLSKKYEDIPNPADAHNESELSEALLESIKKMAVKENDNSPEHNFFIGLAYLSGIDVEVDHERAVALITSAANAGVAAAAKKLVAIYKNGIGVKCDYQKVIFWQNRLVSLLESGEVIKVIDKSLELMDALWDLGGYYHETGEISEALKVFVKMLDVGKSQYKDTLWSRIAGCLIPYSKQRQKINRYIAIAYEKCGNMYERLDDVDSALKYYRNALTLKKINYNPNDLNSIEDMLNCYKRLGIVQKQLGDFDKALHCFLKCLEYGKAIYELDGSKTNIPFIYNQIGMVYAFDGDDLHAIEFLVKAANIAKEILAIDEENLYSLSCAVDSYNLIGIKQDSIEEARKYHFEALNCVEKYMKSVERFDVLWQKAATLSFISRTFLKERDFINAEGYELSALQIRKKLYDTFTNDRSIKELSLSYMNLGYISKEQNNFEQASQFYEKSYELLLNVTNVSMSTENNIATLLYLIAMVDSKHPNKEKLNKAYVYLKKLIEKYPNNEELQSKLEYITEVLNDL